MADVVQIPDEAEVRAKWGGFAFTAANKKKGKHVITSAVEHHAVLYTLQAMEREGLIDLTILPVDEYAVVSAESVANALRDDTVLVSGGRRGLDVELSPHELVRLTGASVAVIAAG